MFKKVFFFCLFFVFFFSQDVTFFSFKSSILQKERKETIWMSEFVFFDED